MVVGRPAPGRVWPVAVAAAREMARPPTVDGVPRRPPVAEVPTPVGRGRQDGVVPPIRLRQVNGRVPFPDALAPLVGGVLAPVVAVVARPVRRAVDGRVVAPTPRRRRATVDPCAVRPNAAGGRVLAPPGGLFPRPEVDAGADATRHAVTAVRPPDEVASADSPPVGTEPPEETAPGEEAVKPPVVGRRGDGDGVHVHVAQVVAAVAPAAETGRAIPDGGDAVGLRPPAGAVGETLEEPEDAAVPRTIAGLEEPAHSQVAGGDVAPREAVPVTQVPPVPQAVSPVLADADAVFHRPSGAVLAVGAAPLGGLGPDVATVRVVAGRGAAVPATRAVDALDAKDGVGRGPPTTPPAGRVLRKAQVHGGAVGRVRPARPGAVRVEDVHKTPHVAVGAPVVGVLAGGPHVGRVVGPPRPALGPRLAVGLAVETVGPLPVVEARALRPPPGRGLEEPRLGLEPGQGAVATDLAVAAARLGVAVDVVAPPVADGTVVVRDGRRVPRPRVLPETIVPPTCIPVPPVPAEVRADPPSVRPRAPRPDHVAQDGVLVHIQGVPGATPDGLLAVGRLHQVRDGGPSQDAANEVARAATIADTPATPATPTPGAGVPPPLRGGLSPLLAVPAPARPVGRRPVALREGAHTQGRVARPVLGAVVHIAPPTVPRGREDTGLSAPAVTAAERPRPVVAARPHIEAPP